MSKEDGGPAAFLLVHPSSIVLIDDADFQRVNMHGWRIGQNGYVYRIGGRKKDVLCLLHRFILNAKRGQETHHLNGDRLDNRRINLRLTDASEHQRKYHRRDIIARNQSRRVHPIERICKGCGELFVVHPDHRGRNRYCSKLCGNRNKPRRSQNVKTR